MRPTNLDIYIYLRKSRKDLEEEKKALVAGDSYDTLERHRRNLLNIVKTERHNIVRIYEEVVSGESVADRPQVQAMLRAVETGEADAVLVMDLDRLGRGDMLDQGLLDRAFRYSGTKILTPSEIYDPESETWELVFGIKSIVAREELKAITRRMQRGRTSSASEGKSITKVPPYGYLRDENLRLYPDVETGWVVRKMFEMMRDGHGRQAIANELDRLGIKPPNPKRETWSPSSITAIIKNEVYIGNIVWGQIKHVKRDGKYKKIRQPRENWTIKENAHEPIVSREIFDAANRAHTGRFRPSTVPTKKLSNPLAGILKCELCGYAMLYQPRINRPNPMLRCAQPSCKGKQKSAMLKLVEEFVLGALKEVAEEIEERVNDDEPVDKDSADSKEILINKKESEVAELNSQKSKLHDLLERGIYDIDTFLDRQKNLTGRITALSEEINCIKTEINKEKMRRNSTEELLPQIKHVLAAYKDADIVRKNQLLKTVIQEATYLRLKDWTKPDQFLVTIYPHIKS